MHLRNTSVFSQKVRNRALPKIKRLRLHYCLQRENELSARTLGFAHHARIKCFTDTAGIIKIK
jgi:hypothetical protein